MSKIELFRIATNSSEAINKILGVIAENRLITSLSDEYLSMVDHEARRVFVDHHLGTRSVSQIKRDNKKEEYLARCARRSKTSS